MSKTNALTPPSSLTTAVPQTTSAIELIDGAVKKVNALPSGQTPIVPAMEGHIVQAKKTASSWTETVRPDLVNALNGVASWSQTFDAMFDDLMQAAKAIANGDLGGVSAFKAALQKLQEATSEQSTHAHAAEPELQAFDHQVNRDGRGFEADAQSANTAVSNARSQATAARKRLSELEAKRAKKQAILKSLGFLSPLAYAIEKIIEALSGQIKSEQQAFQQAQKEEAQAMQTYQSASEARGIAESYKSATGSISTGVNGLMNGWETLDGNFETLLQSEDITTFNVFTQDVLQSVKSDWENLAEQAKSLQG